MKKTLCDSCNEEMLGAGYSGESYSLSQLLPSGVRATSLCHGELRIYIEKHGNLIDLCEKCGIRAIIRATIKNEKVQLVDESDDGFMEAIRNLPEKETKIRKFFNKLAGWCETIWKKLSSDSGINRSRRANQ